MDVITLLRTAQDAGLKIKAEGDTVRVRGPKRAEPIVRCIMAMKSQVLRELMKSKSSVSSTWDSETARLIQWFLEEGQHRIPTKPFQLTRWQRVVDPALFMESIHFGISIGPDKVNLWRGTFQADLKRLKELIGQDSSEGEQCK